LQATVEKNCIVHPEINPWNNLRPNRLWYQKKKNLGEDCEGNRPQP